MSYFPVLNVPNAKCWTTVYNFAPNNWEVTRNHEQYLNVTFSTEKEWITESLGVVPKGGIKTVTADDLHGLVADNVLALLSLTRTPIPKISRTLPDLGDAKTATPAWRATIGISSSWTQTSYQGELDPFPQSGTLLSFAPFLQFGMGIENYMIFLNLEKSPTTRLSDIEIYDTKKLNLKGRFIVRNNSSNMIPLNNFGLNENDLPLIICKNMAGIPLYFSRTADSNFMSLEHTHPPASFVVHGNRWEAQKLLKQNWFAKLS